MATLDQTISQTHDWVLNRVHELTEESFVDGDLDALDDGYAIVQEFAEWLDPNDQEYDVISLEYIGEGSEYE
tara:strand:+ start:532 stop:747 length:216 start_codon:yes stop_codon:yes gene_type:complete